MDIIWGAFYTNSGAAATGLTVTVDIISINRSTGAEALVASAASMTEATNADGIYTYRQASADTSTYTYFAVATTAGTVDQADVAAVATFVEAEATSIATGAITAAAIDTGAIDADAIAADAGVEIASAVWDRVLTGATHNISNSAGRRLRSIPETIGSTIVDATPTTTEFATALAGSYVDDHFNDQVLHIISGDVASQVGVIVDYVGATGTIILDEPLTAAPANGDAFEILSTHVHPKSQIADAIWDELKAGHIAAGSFGEEVQSHALSTEVDAVPTVSEIWAGLGDTEKNAIADALLTRGVSNVEDTAGAETLCELVLAAFESSMPVGSSTWTIKKTDGVTTFNTRTVTTDASAEGITSVT